MKERLEDFSLGKKMIKEGDLQKIGVVGAGSTGQEIIRLAARKGIEVAFVDVSEEQVKEILVRIERALDAKINHWGLTEGEKRAMMSRIKGSADYSILKGCNIVIESINSKKPGTSLLERKEVFRKIEEVISPKATIASNTATLMISEISSILKHQERAIGMHFILPLDHVKVVEVVRTVRTCDFTMNCISKFLKMLERELIEVQESPGNISTRMIVPLINEACAILLEGVADVVQIDKTIKNTTGLLSGPFEMADTIGLDKVLKWMENLYNEFGDIRYKPSPFIKRLVRAGMVGRRAGEGFYLYKDGKRIQKKGNVLNLGRNSKANH
ncbi:MAG: 3-hydroxyacyl-CoA dehydrogenase family protein [Bacteroidales bacterium]|nr:3-hydroxyacyl-CoA dehydrogenase family protein [Bacteroidales bacterium]